MKAITIFALALMLAGCSTSMPSDSSGRLQPGETLGPRVKQDTPVYQGQLMPDSAVYQIRKTDTGELYVYCANGADATIRPTNEFGSIVVSCGK